MGPAVSTVGPTGKQRTPMSINRIFPIVIAAAGLVIGVQQYTSLREGDRALLAVKDRVADTVRRGGTPQEGATVILSGTPVIEEKAFDPAFGIAPDTLDLTRKARITQWTENCGAKSCSYALKLVDQEIPSGRFRTERGHENYGALLFASIHRPASFTIDNMPVSDDFIAHLGQPTRIEISPEDYSKFPDTIKANLSLNPDGSLSSRYPAGVGDQLYEFSGVPAAPYTIVGTFADGKVIPLRDFQRNWVRPGLLSIDELYDRAALAHRRDYILPLLLAGFLLFAGASWLIFNRMASRHPSTSKLEA